jgi:hypothetical protein
VPAPTAAELRARDARRLLFYARPEPHAARNMFELGILALQRAARAGAFDEGWELHGIGAVDGSERAVMLTPGTRLRLLPRAGQGAYAQVLRDHDLGLALMYTPHPSLVPLEMASAGMLTVTNTFENKTQAALSEISSNLVAARPTVEDVAEALCASARSVADHERRAAGAAVNWSRQWEDSFPEPLLEQIARWLGRR